MYAVRSRALWCVQLLSNIMNSWALWWPSTYQYGSKWWDMISACYFVEFHVPLICTSSILPYQNVAPKFLLNPPQVSCCASGNPAWLPRPMLTPHVMSAITKMRNEKVLAYHFWHCTFRYMKMSYCFPHRFCLQRYTGIDHLWLPWYCPCSILPPCG